MPIGQLDPTVMVRLRQLIAQREAEKELRGLVEPPRTTRPSGLPDVPPPPMVRNLGITTTRPDLVKRLEQIQQIAPRAGVGVHTISTAPSRAVLDYTAASGINPAKFDQTSLLGATDLDDPGRIYIDRNLEGAGINPTSILVHELVHSANPDRDTAGEGPSQVGEGDWGKATNLKAVDAELFGRYKLEQLLQQLRAIPGIVATTQKR